jgi:phosphotransferase system  glucose/maltose/N-acetylglucosamine-specific IIC component
MANSKPEHVDIDEYEDSPPSANTAASGAFTDIVVTVPERITIRMVNAAALEDYEIWFFIASILASAVIGFLVAFFQAVDGNSASVKYIGWTCAVFVVLFVVAIVVALRKRALLRQEGRDIRLRTTGASTEH